MLRECLFGYHCTSLRHRCIRKGFPSLPIQGPGAGSQLTTARATGSRAIVMPWSPVIGSGVADLQECASAGSHEGIWVKLLGGSARGCEAPAFISQNSHGK